MKKICKLIQSLINFELFYLLVELDTSLYKLVESILNSTYEHIFTNR